MSITMYQYPKCSTCRNAVKYLNEQGVEFTSKHIVEETPSKAELASLIEKSGLPIQRFFNTSGIKYREMGLSAKLPEMSDEEKLNLLASDGMLIKRPIVVEGNKVTLGFKEDVFKREWVK